MSKPEPYIDQLFMDSGAFSLFNKYVAKRKKLIGAHGRELAPLTKIGWTDYTFFDLSPGTEFRKYCDHYASFIKKFENSGMYFANVDVIKNPQKTWETQQFFEKEHGVKPVPVIHSGTDMKWVVRYLEAGYDFLGIGGGQNFGSSNYIKWADELFLTICPASNKYYPLVRTHGFALTSYKLVVRWPWWSVDSATWLKMAAYGWLLIPRWSESKNNWTFNHPPYQIGMTMRSPALPMVNKHIDSMQGAPRQLVQRWLDQWGLPLGKVDKNGKMIEWGACSHSVARQKLNLHYFQSLAESRPKWPYPLSENIQHARASYTKGFRE